MHPDFEDGASCAGSADVTKRMRKTVQVGVMMRIGTGGNGGGFAGVSCWPCGAPTRNAPSGVRLAQATPPDAPPPALTRPPTRLRVTPYYRAGRRLSALLSRSGCGARVQRHLRAGIPAERHGDRAAHELPLAPRLIGRLTARAARRSVRRRRSLRRRHKPGSPSPTVSERACRTGLDAWPLRGKRRARAERKARCDREARYPQSAGIRP